MSVIDPRAQMAARNNADLYAAVFETHGIGYVRQTYAFVAQDRPPPYYSDMTIVAPGHGNVIGKIIRERGGHVGIKDSFCELDAAAFGLRPLFAASWIWREAMPHHRSSDWQHVLSADQLEQWEAAWKQSGSPADQRMFPTTMLDRPDVSFLFSKDGDRIVAGCIANRSADCVGLSNVFAIAPRADLYEQAACAVSASAPGRPIVGYEWGDDLNAAQSAGFETTGQLRVLVPTANP